MPVPLRDRFAQRASAVWSQALDWKGSNFVFIQAPSGTGKTTLVHLLYGLRTDYDGDISWGGSSLRGMDAEALGRLRREEVSVVFQDMRLFPALTAWENLEVKRVLTNSVTQEQVRAWMGELGISDRADRTASTLSYGEQQRVAIIRALIQPFKWLLMDEPFSHLDKANTVIATRLIGQVVAENRASAILADLDENDYFPYTQKIVL